MNLNILLDCIGVAGFIMSTVSWIYTYMVNRKILTITVHECRHSGVGYNFYLSIDNKSQLSIAVTNIELVTESGAYAVHAVPEIARHRWTRVGNEYTHDFSWENIAMPINIPSLGSTGGYLLFQDCRDALTTDATEVTFRVYTNRGRPNELLSRIPHHTIQ